MVIQTVSALLLTLISAVAINWGYLIEHGAASELPPLSGTRPLRSVGLLLASRSWRYGFLLETGGFVLYVVALALAPLALVQSVAAGGIGVLALLVARVSGTPLQPRERIGVAIAIAGLVLLAISLAGGTAEGVAVAWYAIGLWLAASVGAAVAVITVGARPLPGGAGFGLAAGILFSAGDIATKEVVSGGNHLVLGPAIVGFYAAGTFALQSGFQHGRALTTAGIATLATNAIPILAAMTLFREPLPGGALGLTRVAAFASVVIGAVWLAPKRPSAPKGEADTTVAAANEQAAQPLTHPHCRTRSRRLGSGRCGSRSSSRPRSRIRTMSVFTPRPASSGCASGLAEGGSHASPFGFAFAHPLEARPVP